LQTGHLLSPMFLAWTHAGFRQVMLRHKIKYVVLPLLIMAVCASIGYFASLGLTHYRPDINLQPQLGEPIDIKNPLVIMVWIYLLWNAYHFAMQNFGILS